MTHRTRICIALCVLSSAALAQDLQIDAASVSNAASYIAPNYPNGGVSHGGMFIVKAAAGSGALGACGVKVADQFPIATAMNGTTTAMEGSAAVKATATAMNSAPSAVKTAATTPGSLCERRTGAGNGQGG